MRAFRSILCCGFSSVFCCTPVAADELRLTSPQEFTRSLYTFCQSNTLDDFLNWVSVLDLSKMNRPFKENEMVLPEAEKDDTELLRCWKVQYYEKFKGVQQTKPFLLAGEFYPYSFLVHSAALAFHELSTVTRICILLSGKLGCPEAERILLLENPGNDVSDTDIERYTQRVRDNEECLCELLETPFVWNNIRLMDVLREDIRLERVAPLIESGRTITPFAFLNGYFLADELSRVDGASIGWLHRAQGLGSILATIRLNERGYAIIEVPLFTGYQRMVNAQVFRFGEGVDWDIKEAARLYEEALTVLPDEPSLHMDIAEFYKDLYMAEACEELECPADAIQQKIWRCLKAAHDLGDGNAAVLAVQFLTYLNHSHIDFVGCVEWELPAADIPEALTRLYELAYLRVEEPLFLIRIQELKKRTEHELQQLERRAIRSIAFRSSIIRWGT